MSELNTDLISLSELVSAALTNFSVKQKDTFQLVAMEPGRNAMSVDNFIRRKTTTPFTGGEGVLLGASTTRSPRWEYLHLRPAAGGGIRIETDEDAAGVTAIELPHDVDVLTLSSAVIDQFIALGAFTRQQWQA